MGKRVVLMPLARRNSEGTRHEKQLFITVNEKKLLKEKEQDLLRLIIVEKPKEEQYEVVEPKITTTI